MRENSKLKYLNTVKRYTVLMHIILSYDDDEDLKTENLVGVIKVKQSKILNNYNSKKATTLMNKTTIKVVLVLYSMA
jgi:hypothetical protein